MSSPSSQNEVVTVFHFGSSTLAPSASPFTLKLMTYLRMTDINYKIAVTTRTSSKGKSPFISHKGKEIADSTFIVDFLNSEYSKNLNATLNSSEKAVALAFQRLCEENLYWAMVHCRWFLQFDEFLNQFPLSNMKKKLMSMYATVRIKPTQKSNMTGHGIGRHSNEEIFQIAQKDLSALSEFLNDKEYFMGSEPTEVDSVVFGIVAQFAYAMPNTEYNRIVKEKFANLISYSDRMKKKYWPDWDAHCSKDKTAQLSEEKLDSKDKASHEVEQNYVKGNTEGPGESQSTDNTSHAESKPDSPKEMQVDEKAGGAEDKANASQE